MPLKEKGGHLDLTGIRSGEPAAGQAPLLEQAFKGHLDQGGHLRGVRAKNLGLPGQAQVRAYLEIAGRYVQGGQGPDRAHLSGGQPDLFPRLNRVLVNTGITKLAVGRAGISLVSFNEHAHLDDGGGQLLTYR